MSNSQQSESGGILASFAEAVEVGQRPGWKGEGEKSEEDQYAAWPVEELTVGLL
jgi:hypothetical protein